MLASGAVRRPTEIQMAGLKTNRALQDQYCGFFLLDAGAQ